LDVSRYFDFNTGKLNLNYTLPDITLAFQEYIQQAAKYTFLDYGFELPSPVPADLLMPFRDFATKYSLEPLLPVLWRQTKGVGNMFQTPTIYVLKYFGNTALQSLQAGFLTTAAGDNSALYESASRVLDPNVLYNSTLLDMERETKWGVQIVVQTATETILVKSKRLIIAIQPLLADMDAFDLSVREHGLFSQFKSNEYFARVLRNTDIPDNITLVNIDPSQPYGIPLPPNLFSISQTGYPGLQSVTYLSTTNPSNEKIRQEILDGLEKLEIRDANGEPEFAVSSIHTPFELIVSADAIQQGFYTQLHGLQGQRNTWYTSATFHAQDSSLIWRFTESLLPNITA
jgi:hypothetical protein